MRETVEVWQRCLQRASWPSYLPWSRHTGDEPVCKFLVMKGIFGFGPDDVVSKAVSSACWDTLWMYMSEQSLGDNGCDAETGGMS